MSALPPKADIAERFVFNAAMALSGVARVGQLQPFVIIVVAFFANGEQTR